MARRALAVAQEVDIFTDGSVVLERVASGGPLPDVIVLDWQLPGISGARGLPHHPRHARRDEPPHPDAHVPGRQEQRHRGACGRRERLRREALRHGRSHRACRNARANEPSPARPDATDATSEAARAIGGGRRSDHEGWWPCGGRRGLHAGDRDPPRRSVGRNLDASLGHAGPSSPPPRHQAPRCPRT